MIKSLIFLKRKPGLTHQQFRDHFENVHVRLAQQHLTHLMTRYVRSYIGGPSEASRRPEGFDYDCISEWIMPDQAALDGIYAILADPEIGPKFREDEERFLDRSATMVVRCGGADLVDTGT